jgi:hypothetical protein
MGNEDTVRGNEDMIDYFKRRGPPRNLHQVRFADPRETFAWFNPRGGAHHSSGWEIAVTQVASLAEREDWSCNHVIPAGEEPRVWNGDVAQLHDYFQYLWRYIANTYVAAASKWSTDGPRMLKFSDDGWLRAEYMVFDTGLLMRSTKDPIFALFKKNDRRNSQPYVFLKWCAPLCIPDTR